MATKINPRKYSKHGEHRIILSSNRISNLSIGDIKEYKMDSSKRKLNIKWITIKEWFIRCTC